MIDKNGNEKKYRKIDWGEELKTKTDIGANPTCVIDCEIQERDDGRVVLC